MEPNTYSWSPDVLRREVTEVMSVAQNVRLTKVPKSKYFQYVNELFKAPPTSTSLDALPDIESRLSFVIVRDAINFGSGFHPLLAKHQGLSGARTIEHYLLQMAINRGIPTANYLSEISPQVCASMLGQSMQSEVAILMNMFATAWNELGRHTLTHYDGHFSGIAESSASAVELVNRLAVMPCWRDSSAYKRLNIDVAFMKRAQLATHGCEIAKKSRMPGSSSLTIFADNLIPHVLRLDGFIHLDEKVANRIDIGDLIDHGSKEEIEIRAAAVYVCAEMVEAANNAGMGISELELSSQLWKRGQSSRYKSVLRHRTRCFAY